MSFRGAGIILLSSDLQVLLIQDQRTQKWGFPKGHREPEDTSDVATAQREVQEEIGLDPTTYTLHPTSFRILRGTSSYLFRYAILNQSVSDTHLRLQHKEIAGYLWVSLALFYLNSEIVDGNKYLRTWIQDITTRVLRKSYTILCDILAAMNCTYIGDISRGDGGRGILIDTS